MGSVIGKPGDVVEDFVLVEKVPLGWTCRCNQCKTTKYKSGHDLSRYRRGIEVAMKCRSCKDIADRELSYKCRELYENNISAINIDKQLDLKHGVAKRLILKYHKGVYKPRPVTVKNGTDGCPMSFREIARYLGTTEEEVSIAYYQGIAKMLKRFKADGLDLNDLVVE